jgi:glycine/D-amino acid oxidase-like deaminating enzyme
VAAEEVMTLAEPVVVNCTGLGAKALFDDDELIPVKGQLCVLAPQPEVDYVVSTADGLYMQAVKVMKGGDGAFGSNSRSMAAAVVGSQVWRANLSYMLAGDIGDQKEAMVRVLEVVAR